MNRFVEKLNTGKPIIMGIVNVTPDSFSDGGRYNTVDRAVAHGMQLVAEGADILDIGGESTRPGADIVSVEEEIARVCPVIEGLRDAGVDISIDSRNSKTMECAINSGASIINDISALSHDVNSVNIVHESGLPVCLMHMRGIPQTMQKAPAYRNVVDDVCHFFEERIDYCDKNNIDTTRIIIDPGLGFGKTVGHNLSLIRHIDRFKTLECPVLFGASRKSFIGSVCDQKDPEKRVSGSLTTALYAFQHGAQIFRVHDVAQTRQMFDIYHAIQNAD